MSRITLWIMLIAVVAAHVVNMGQIDTINKLNRRLTALESRCAPIEQAGDLPSFMTEAGPAEVIHYE